MRLGGRVVLITGAASGIGKAGALLFAQEGASVIVADVNDEWGQETVKQIREAGGEACYVHTNVAVVAELESMVKSAIEKYGRLDVFWHNAGVVGPGHIERTNEEEFDLTIGVHVKGGFFGSKFAIPEIKRSGGGSIMFTTSIAGYKPSPGSPTYSIAKAGLAILTRCLAVQLAKDNIRVNCIAPGQTKTGMWPSFLRRDPDLVDPAAFEKKILEMTPMGRYAEVEEIAKAALYLISDEASFITGAMLAVDGGMLAT